MSTLDKLLSLKDHELANLQRALLIFFYTNLSNEIYNIKLRIVGRQWSHLRQVYQRIRLNPVDSHFREEYNISGIYLKQPSISQYTF